MPARFGFSDLARGAVALVLLTHSAVGCSDSAADSVADVDVDTASEHPALDSFIEDVAANVGLPGVQTAVIKDGSIVWAKSYGMAAIAPLPERPMTNDTISVFAEISNELIAVAFMQQVEAGVIGLDDDINAALPWSVRNPSYPDVPITWRMIFAQTASFNDIQEVYDDLIVFGTDSPIPLGDFLRDMYTPGGRYYAAGTFLGVRPGQLWQRSSLAVGLAAYAIELLVDQPFHEYAKVQIMDPLGIESTSYFLRELPPDQLAVGYACDVRGEGFACTANGAPGGTSLEQQYSFPFYPVTLLRTSAVQYLELLGAISNGGRLGSASILSEASIEQLLEPLPVETDDGRQQGLYNYTSTDQMKRIVAKLVNEFQK